MTTSLSEPDMSTARRIFVISNTPLFFISRMKEEDYSINKMSKVYSGNEILDALRQSVSSVPETLDQLIKPYLYLLYLSSRDDPRDILNSLGINPSYEDDWYTFIRKVLVDTYKPTYTDSINVKNINDELSISSSSANTNTFTYQGARQ